MKSSFKNSDGQGIVENLVRIIKTNVERLTELDGQIADGDHGINMDKGFSITGRRLDEQTLNLADSLILLGDVLLSEIGGTMGPIYGSLFIELGDGCQSYEDIDSKLYLKMFNNAKDAVVSLGSAEVGDKTMMDTLVPGINALEKSVSGGETFTECLQKMSLASKQGMDSTKEMMAKVGRSARLGERSRGVLDAGAVSCYLIVKEMADSIQVLLKG